MNFSRRLGRLEADRRVVAGKRKCCACGGPADWKHWKPGPDELNIRVVHGPSEPTGPDHCPGCGRALVFRVEFDAGG